MRSSILLTILIVVILTSISGFTGYYLLSNVQSQKGFVTNVIDGDTIELETGEKVRLLGINSAEVNEYYYKEAKDRLHDLVNKKSVKLEAGTEDKDRYGRLLRYVFIGDTFVNLEMVKDGYAKVYILNPGDKYYSELKDAEQDAKENRFGLWKTLSSNCISIEKFNYDAPGSDNENLNGEYVTFANNCDKLIDLKGWTIKDNSARKPYTFGTFTLSPNSEFTLFSGDGTDTRDKLYWNSGKYAVWNNDGDTLFLRDNAGNLVLTYSYPNN